MKRYSRLLIDISQVEHFLFDVLEFEPDLSEDKIIGKILSSEKCLSDYENDGVQTLHNPNYRIREYKSEEDRWGLRKLIIEELFTNLRFDDDDDIKLGSGGALPKSGILADKNAYIVIGLPASGKSGISNKIADDTNSIIVDSDYAKRKLPEFHQVEWGASLVHKESSQIINGFDPNPHKLLSLRTRAIAAGYNIVIPTIGNEPGSLLNMVNALKSMDYRVHLTLVALPKKDATIRAIRRFNKTNRYVPIGMIFDDFSNDPTLTYYMLQCRHSHLFESFGVISTKVTLGDAYYSLDLRGENPAQLYELKNDLLD